MPVDLFSKYVSGFTSDHTYQSAAISTETADHKRLSLTGLTWNLLNRCHSALEKGFSNNPFDLDETDNSYAIRKKKQLKYLWKKIVKRHIDFAFLQEVDIFTGEPLIPAAKSFLRVLKKRGWGIIKSTKEDNLMQPMITLYNKKKLEFQSKKAVCPARDGKFTALEVLYKHKKSGEMVCLTNMHLDFRTDHAEDILNYQHDKIEKGIFTIIGGDTNPHTNVVYYNLIGDENTSTSINKEKKSLRHDGFMASPASKNSRVTIIEKECAYFKWVPTNSIVKYFKQRRGKEVKDGKYKVIYIDPEKDNLTHTKHISLPGSPWIRKAFEYVLTLGGRSGTV